jgi:hypothetical protein
VKSVSAWGKLDGPLGGMYPLSQLRSPPPPLSCFLPIQLKHAVLLLHSEW